MNAARFAGSGRLLFVSRYLRRSTLATPSKASIKLKNAQAALRPNDLLGLAPARLRLDSFEYYNAAVKIKSYDKVLQQRNTDDSTVSV